MASAADIEVHRVVRVRILHLRDLRTISRGRRPPPEWFTTYTEDELVSLFGTAGWRCSDRRTWTTADGDERIFVFERR
jgi:hypothetical protein